jgi:hypothetical protein
MSVTVFEWDMFKKRPGADRGVGHASMHVHGDKGAVYISFWPTEHSLRAGLHSPGVVHFINGDKAADGMPDWASKPISNLDEAKIISWWGQIQHNPLLDYKHKTALQKSGAAHAADGNSYSILFNQCSTVVVKALMVGADIKLRAKIWAWLAQNSGSTPLGLHVPTVTPTDVKDLVQAVF